MRSPWISNGVAVDDAGNTIDPCLSNRRQAQQGGRNKEERAHFHRPRRLGSSTFGIGSFAMNFLADQLLGHLGEVGGEFVAEFLKLGPENLFDETPWRFHDNRLLMHAAIAGWLDAIATAQSDEQLT